jgi:DNA-directed RNA polymerase subunit beta'
VKVGDVWRGFRRNPVKPVILPVVCRVLPICLKPEKPKTLQFWRKQPGMISFGKETKGKQRIIITDSTGEQFETLVPKWRHITVFEGEFVEKGETIAEGELTPHDILRLRGIED